MSLLLIDNRVSDQKTVIDALLPDTKYVIVDYDIDTLESLQNKITEVAASQNVTNVGIFQENYNRGTYQYIGSFGAATLADVENVDPEIATWADFTNLLTYFTTVLNITNVDLMGCNIHKDPNWRYVITKLEGLTGLVLRSSDDYTGSSELGGNWILESDNVDLIGTYFTESIKNYNFILNATASCSFIISSDNKLYGIGGNYSGQLGNGNTTNSGSYVSTNFPNGYIPVQYSSGNGHTIVLTSIGTVYGCGNNSNGQLGNISDPALYFTNIPLPNNKLAIQVASCNSSSLILFNDGTVYGCGQNYYGQLGCGDNIDKSTLTQMINTTGKRIIQIVPGTSHVVVMMEDGSLYSCGYNYYGQLGIGISGGSNANSTLTKITIPGNRMPKQITCGGNTTSVLMTDNTIWSCGRNQYGQLGNNSSTDTSSLVQMINNTGRVPKQIVAAAHVTLVLMDNNSIYACGSNVWGQLMNGSSEVFGTDPVTVHSTLSLCNNNTGKIPSNILNTGGTVNNVIMTDGTVYQAGSIYDSNGTSLNTTTSLTQMKYSNGTFVTNASPKQNATILLSNGGKTYDGGVYFLPNNNYDKFIYTPDLGINPSGVFINGLYGTLDSKDVNTSVILSLQSIGLNEPYNTNYLFARSQIIRCNITPRPITYTVISTKIYDGNNTAPVTLNFNNLVYSETPNITYTATYDDINVGSRNVTVTSLTLINNGTFLVNNYSYDSSIQSFSGTITPKSITYTGTSTKTYDGNNTAVVTFHFDGLVNSENPNTTYIANYDDSNVGTRTVTVTSVILVDNGTFKANNYSYSSSIPSFSGSITTRPLTYSYTYDKAYDGTTNRTLNFNYTGLVVGETPNTIYTATYNNPNVGPRVLSVSNILLVNNQNTGFVTTNYSYTNILAQSLSDNITPRILTVFANITDKIYNGSNNATDNITLTFTGLIGTQTPIYNMYASYVDADAGNNKAIGFDHISLSDNYPFLSSNYTINTYPNITGNILKKELNVNITGSTPKIYDGNNNATSNTIVSLVGIVDGETTTAVFTSIYDDTDVGKRTITVSTINVSDNLPFKKDNYTIINNAQYLNGSIIPKQLTISIGPNGVTSKEYNGNTNATVDLQFTGVVSGQIISYIYSATFNNKNVNLNKLVTINNITLQTDGNFKSTNYTLGTYPTAYGTITRRNLTVSVTNVTDKVYNGLVDDANQHVTLDVSGAISGETPSYTFEASYDEASVGTNKTITITSMDLNNNSPFLSSNYTIETYPTTVGKITNAELIANIGQATKVYDGTTDTGSITLTFDGLVTGEIPLYPSYSITFDDPNVGINKGVTINNVNFEQNGSFNPTNYIIKNNSLTSNTGTITAKSVTVTPNTVSNKIYDGNNLADVHLQFTGLVSGETPIYTCLATFSNYNAGPNRIPTVNNITYLENGNFKPNNYSFSFTPNNTLKAIISKRTLTYTLSKFTKPYDGNILATPNIIFSGLVTGETPNYTSDGAYETPDVGTGKTVTLNSFNLLTNSATKFNPGNYDYFIDTVTVNDAEITPRLIIPDINNLSKVYDGTDSTNITFIYTNLVSGETPNYNYTSKYDDKNAKNQQTIRVSNIVLGVNGNFKPTNYSYDTSIVIDIPECKILPKQLTAQVVSVQNKEYDGTTDATTALSIENTIAGENANYTCTSTFSDANVGLGKIVTVNNITLHDDLASGFLSTNYIITPNQIGHANITKKSLQINNISVIDKEYDGTNSAITTLTFLGTLGTQAANYISISTFNNSNVGTNKQITVNTITLLDDIASGFLANNYAIVAGQLTTGNIIPKTLTVNNILVQNKEYDGNNVANTTLTFVGIAGTEVANYNCTSTFNDSNVGTNKQVTINTITLSNNLDSGFLATNYSIVAGQLTTGNITPKTLTFQVTGVTPKVYDGTNIATVTHTVSGTLETEVAKYTLTGSFNNANVGNNKPLELNIVLQDDIVSGFLANNYVVNATQVGTGNITPKPLNATITSVANKVYDGKTTALAVLNVTGSVTGETPLWTNTAIFNTKNAGNNKTVTVNSITLKNNGAFIATNYSITAGQTKLANITKRLLGFKYAVKARKYIKGNKKAIMVFSNYNKLATDLVAISKYTATYNNDIIGNNKQVTMTGVILGGRDSGNYYVLSKYTTKGNITK